MNRKPGGDNPTEPANWEVLLTHRPEPERAAAAARFADSGVRPELVERTLADAGDALFAAAVSTRPDWTEDFGGPLAVALLAAEVSALAAHLNSRASGVRALAVNALLDDFSAVTIAGRLGVSRQKIYDIARGGLTMPYIDSVPRRQP